MLRSLEQFQNGSLSSKSFQASTATHRMYDLELSNHCSLEIFHTSGVNALDIDRVEERYILSGGKDGALCIHDLRNLNGRPSYKAKTVCMVPRGSRHSHKFSIDTVQWYPFDTGLFTTSGMDCKIKIWDSNVLKPADAFQLPSKVSCHNMSFISSRHSLIAAAMEYPHVILLDPKSGSRCHELRAHRGRVSCVRWSPSSEYLLASGGIDNKILLWDIRSAKGYLRALDQHNGEAQSSKSDLITAHNGIVNAIRFTDDGLHMISYGTDCRLRLWDVALSTNTLVNYGLVMNNSQYKQRGIDLYCGSNPPVVFVPTSNYINVYDLFSGCKIKELVGHFSLVNCCSFRSTAHQLFSGGNDMNILMWTPDVKQEVEDDTMRQGLAEVGYNGISSQHSDNWSSDED